MYLVKKSPYNEDFVLQYAWDEQSLKKIVAEEALMGGVENIKVDWEEMRAYLEDGEGNKSIFWIVEVWPVKLNIEFLKLEEEDDMVKVKNMESSSGKGVLHQFIIYTNDGIYFQSYDSIIVKMTPEKTYLDRKRWDFSTTTGKYRNIFLGEKKDETERKIKSGIYILEDLN